MIENFYVLRPSPLIPQTVITTKIQSIINHLTPLPWPDPHYCISSKSGKFIAFHLTFFNFPFNTLHFNSFLAYSSFFLNNSDFFLLLTFSLIIYLKIHWIFEKRDKIGNKKGEENQVNNVSTSTPAFK